jgi:polar amino acid transport system substrate-binding protein
MCLRRSNVGKKLSLFLIIMCLFVVSGCRNSEKASDVLRVGMDLKYPPFMYMDDSGEPVGLEVDIAKAFGQYLDKEIEIINTDFSMLIPSLETGETDILISDISVNEERKQKVAFTKPYRYGKTLALVNREYYEKHEVSDDMDAQSFFDLNDMRAIGLSGTISVSIPRKYGVGVVEITEIASGLMEINSGTSNVLVGSYKVFGDHAANEKTTEIYSGIKDYSMSAFAIRKEDDYLRERANEFIDKMYDKGGLYEQLKEKYDGPIDDYLEAKGLGLEYIITKPE